MIGSYLKKIPKGRGFVYEYEQHLYQRVKTKRDTKEPLKCYVQRCDDESDSADNAADEDTANVTTSTFHQLVGHVWQM